MKDISEFSVTTTEFELFSFLYDKIVNREIITFSTLKQQVIPIIKEKRIYPVLMRLFELIKRLYWGFFSDISPTAYRKLWEEMVIPDRHFSEAGDLKRTLSISNLYIGILDIHGYTKFCQDARKNLSMLHALDKAINGDIYRICSKCGVVSHRERGDEIVLTAASATDALTAVLCIIDYFARTKVVNDPAIPTSRSGDFAALPEFKISAGISGGNTRIPLVVTADGDLSGFLLNIGARLQVRANELSPNSSRVMVSRQVFLSFTKENAQEKCALAKNNAVFFFDTGKIRFKGVLLPTCEVVFAEKERYKREIADEMLNLYGSLNEALWEQKVFLNLVELIFKSVSVMPPFKVVPNKPVKNLTPPVTNESVKKLCRIMVKAYNDEEDYAAATNLLHDLITILEAVPQYDHLILDYLRGITEKYDMILKSFQASIDKEIDENAASVFSGKFLNIYVQAKKYYSLYEQLLLLGRRSRDITKKKTIWYNLVKQYKDKMAFTLYSGKQ
ncbi:MAG: hypothetical protein LBP76_04620 [Treponema sp.]|nr:hypothetical protein [Treponema sp.]